MIGARKLPVVLVLDVGRVRDRLLAAIGVPPGHALGVPVRVEDGRDQHDAGVQDALDLGPGSRCQVVDEGQCRVHATRFCAVHTVVDPGDGRHIPGNGLIAGRLRQRGVPLANLVEAGVIFRRRCDHEEYRAALMRVADDLCRQAIAQPDDALNIIDELMVSNRLVAQLEAQELCRGRDRGIVDNVDRKHFRIRVAHIDLCRRRASPQEK